MKIYVRSISSLHHGTPGNLNSLSTSFIIKLRRILYGRNMSCTHCAFAEFIRKFILWHRFHDERTHAHTRAHPLRGCECACMCHAHRQQTRESKQLAFTFRTSFLRRWSHAGDAITWCLHHLTSLVHLRRDALAIRSLSALEQLYLCNSGPRCIRVRKFHKSLISIAFRECKVA